MWRDIRHAARTLARTPGFTVSAVVTLSAAIGAAIAIFTVVNATMLTPPPYADPDTLLVLTPRGGGAASPRELSFLRERSRAFSALTAQRTSPGWNLVAGARAEFVEGVEVSERYFEAHGVPLLMGRDISRVEALPDGPRAVVLSEAVWRRLFDAGPDAIGRIVELGGRAHEVVGIAPAGFRSIPDADVWTPMQTNPDRNDAGIRIVGRLRPGVTQADAEAELETLRHELRGVLGNEGRRADVLTWRTYQEWFAAGRRELNVLLLAAVGALLLVACVNVGGLQIARGVGRAREFAARAALGATRMRLFREAFAESIVIVAAAAAMGLGIAAAGAPALVSLLTEDIAADILGGQPVVIDLRVVFVAISLAAVAALISGSAPALAGARAELRTGDASRTTTGRHHVWLRRGFAVGQVAVAVVLLVVAVLSVRTFAHLRAAELGFSPERIVIGEMAVQGTMPDVAERHLFVEQALRRIRDVDGVASVAVTSAVPVDRPLNVGIQAQGAALLPQPRNVDFAYATPDYFDLFAVPLRAGRLFDERDGPTAAPVAIVNEALARTFFGRVNVVGESIQIRVGRFGNPIHQIVGVVGDVRSRSFSQFAGPGLSALSNPPAPMLFIPLPQLSAEGFAMLHQSAPMRWVVKGREGAAGIPEAVREAVRLQDPKRPFRRFLSMEQIIGRDLSVHRFLATLLTIFGAVAMLLATLGLYALIANLVAQRRREVGIRLTLGATAGRVVRLFLSESVRLTAAGVLLGVLAAPFLTRAMAMFLVGVEPLDAPTFAGVAALLLIAATAAALIPARRAARADPAISLKVD